MLNAFWLSAALTVGQGNPTVAPTAPLSEFAAERPSLLSPPVKSTVAPAAGPTRPVMLPFAPTSAPPARLSVMPMNQPAPMLGTPAPLLSSTPMPVTQIPMSPMLGSPKLDPKANGNGEPKNGEPKNDEAKNGEEKKEDDRGYFMRVIDEQYLGGYLKASDVVVDGWVAFSYNTSTRNVTNLPYTWNDRADSALLQQVWVNIAQPVDWEKPEVQHGWNVSLLYGSDYRFTLIRGFLNNQLKNVNPDPRELNGFEQNIYGGDIPVFTYSVFVPGMGGEGTEFTVGRMFCQFGYESVMATSTPLMSRSYAFNWAPPFFHVGAMATTKFTPNVIVKNMIVNGNDVFFDGSQEWRYAGQAVWISDDEGTTLAFGTSIGRGRFDASRPSGPAKGITTIGLAYEPFGRNNMNVFDLVYTTKLGEKTRYAFEAIYGYQTDVPAAATGSAANFNGGTGTARWCSLVNYLLQDFNDHWTGVARFEIFNDYQGQRTGFEGTYYSATLGLQCKPCNEVLIRPEIRYDYNPYSRPFSGRHDIFVAGFDMIVKF
jgi:hypothetical protein